MNFSYKNGLIWISIIIEYNKMELTINNCIMDTGSATTAVDIDLIDFNYKKPSVLKRLKGIGGGTQEVIGQEVDKIIIDGFMIPGVEVEFGDIREDLGINGFIGTDILKNFDIGINFSNMKITLKRF